MHKSYLVLLLLLLMGGQQYSFAQFSGGKLQATGLTCALCNKAIHQSLEELAFVEKVETDIKSSSFNLTFRNDHVVNPSQLKEVFLLSGAAILISSFLQRLLQPQNHLIV
jgi:copper chaperone CopZ